jgi:hypothetical protein
VPTRREDLGSWLEGTPGGTPDESTSALGHAASGRGSLASVGRRLAALVVDWTMSLAISAAFFPGPEPAVVPLLSGDPSATLGVFAVSTVVLVALLGHTVGHRLLGIRVVRLADAVSASGPRPPGPLAALIRTGLLCLVIPAVIWDRSGRGMHDVAARTAIVRR